MKVDDVWHTHRQWAVVTERGRDALNRWRVVNLVLILLGSVLGALAAQQEWFPKGVAVVLGAVGAAALAAAGIIQARLLTAEKTAERAAARATSEALKAIAYRFLAAGRADPDRTQTLSEAVAAIDELTGDRAVLVVGIEPDNKALPSVDGIVDYTEKRARAQRDWHATRTADHKKLAQRWRAAELIATAAAAILAAVGGALHGPSLSAWVAVATTAAAAFAAHLASQQHDRIAQSYARTVLSLTRLLRNFDPAGATSDDEAQFVASVETVLANQNESWTSLFNAWQHHG